MCCAHAAARCASASGAADEGAGRRAQVWRRRGWPLGDEDGCFVQLEARGLRRVWFVRPGAEAAELAEDFKLIEALFRSRRWDAA